ncbi:MAG: hypothetical protein IH587_02645 [Anaerolineae bacterium]|nr:hypothetical protein [Anaerolineae bacterium]
MRAYIPLLSLLVLALIGAAVFSTYVIWRSVIVPQAGREVAEKRKSAASLEQAERGIRHSDVEDAVIPLDPEPTATRKARS